MSNNFQTTIRQLAESFADGVLFSLYYGATSLFNGVGRLCASSCSYPEDGEVTARYQGQGRAA